MARSVDTIQKAIISDVAGQPELATLTTNTSKRAIWRLWTYVMAVAINLLEQLIDIFQAENEQMISLSAPQTAQWVQGKVFEFQYSGQTPQTIQLLNYVPSYVVVNPALRIVTRCSVKSSINNVVNIKTAKSEPPIPLTTNEKNSLQTYINTIGVAGVTYLVQSTASDKLYLDADIYYSGTYSAVISDNVITGINTYLSSIPFDGTFKISDLELAIKAVAGVNDVVFNNVRARKDSDVLGDATYLIQSNTLIGRIWPTISGYMVGETTSGNTFTDTLTFIAE